MRRILCLDLPNWPIQRLLAERNGRRVGQARATSDGPPTLKIKGGPAAAKAALSHPIPILLHARDPRHGDLVVACNTAAQERGVRLMMPLAEAAALAQHDGDCRILPHDGAADLAALARLAEHCERFSPLVGWKTVESRKSKVESPSLNDLRPSTFDLRLCSGPGPDCLFLDVTGIGVLFGGEEILALEVIADLNRLGYEAYVAIADTIGSAWAGARQSSKFKVQGSKLR